MTLIHVGLGLLVAAAVAVTVWRIFFRRYSLWDGDFNQRRRPSDSDDAM